MNYQTLPNLSILLFTPRAWQRILVGLIVLVCAPGSLRSSLYGHETDQPTQQTADSIQLLINQLDSRKYSQREEAMKSLGRAGKSALKPLAMRLLDGSPECSWRIKVILEEIGTRGDSETFLKAVGILKVFVGSTPELLALEKKWEEQQEQFAVDALVELGAVVDVPRRDISPNQFGFQQIIPPGFVVDNPNRNSKTKTAKSGPPKIDPTKARKSIETILSNSSTENRKLVFGKTVEVTSTDDPKSASAVAPRLAQMEFQNDLGGHLIFINGQQINIQQPIQQGITVRLGKTWRGSNSDLDQLLNLRQISKVILDQQDLQSIDVDAVKANRSIQSMVVENCKFSASSLEKLLKDATFRTFGFSNTRVTKMYISKLARFANTYQVEFENCDLSPAAFEELAELKNLSSIKFTGVEIDDEFFTIATELKRLRSIAITACDYNESERMILEASRRDLKISFPPQAFLGVRGTPAGFLDGDSPGCVITEVIENSGAYRAGIEVNDIIRKVDGKPIGDFDQLRVHISSFKSGDTTLMQIERAGKLKTLKVTLGHIDEAPID